MPQYFQKPENALKRANGKIIISYAQIIMKYSPQISCSFNFSPPLIEGAKIGVSLFGSFCIEIFVCLKGGETGWNKIFCFGIEGAKC